MICQSMGFPPISTIGLGRTVVSSASRVPRPPARMITFMLQTFRNGEWGMGSRGTRKSFPTPHCPLPASHCPLPSYQSNHHWNRNGNDEAPAALAVLPLLPHDLFGEIPGENQRIVRLAFNQR